MTRIAARCEQGLGDGRALVLRIQSLRLFSLRASIAIAVFCLAYFAGQLLRLAL
jgi:hypothetical protein